MNAAVLPIGGETVGCGTGSDSRFKHGTGALVRWVLGQERDTTVAAPGVWLMPFDATTTHPWSTLLGVSAPEKVGAEIFEIRRLSGLTWEELATIFDVSRRSLHHWANGKSISAANEVRVRRLLSTLRRIDRGEARRNRALLTSPHPEGGLVIDALRRGEFEAVERLIQPGAGRPSPVGRLAAGASAARRPPSPAVLVDARHDDGPVTRGRFVRVESIPPRRRPDRG